MLNKPIPRTSGLTKVWWTLGSVIALLIVTVALGRIFGLSFPWAATIAIIFAGLAGLSGFMVRTRRINNDVIEGKVTTVTHQPSKHKLDTAGPIKTSRNVATMGLVDVVQATTVSSTIPTTTPVEATPENEHKSGETQPIPVIPVHESPETVQMTRSLQDEVRKLNQADDPLNALKHTTASNFANRHISWDWDEKNQVLYDGRPAFAEALRLVANPMASRWMNQVSKDTEKGRKKSLEALAKAVTFFRYVYGAALLFSLITVLILHYAPPGSWYYTFLQQWGQPVVVGTLCVGVLWAMYVFFVLWPGMRYVITGDYIHLIIRRLPFEEEITDQMPVDYISNIQKTKTLTGSMLGYTHISKIELRQTRETITRLMFVKDGYGLLKPFVMLFRRFGWITERPSSNLGDVMAALRNHNSINKKRDEAIGQLNKLGQLNGSYRRLQDGPDSKR